jgi:hypothetical protein
VNQQHVRGANAEAREIMVQSIDGDGATDRSMNQVGFGAHGKALYDGSSAAPGGGKQPD